MSSTPTPGASHPMQQWHGSGSNPSVAFVLLIMMMRMGWDGFVLSVSSCLDTLRYPGTRIGPRFEMCISGNRFKIHQRKDEREINKGGEMIFERVV